MEFIVRMFTTLSVADDGMFAAQRTPPRQQT